MRAIGLMALLGLAACAAPGAGQSDNVARASLDSAPSHPSSTRLHASSSPDVVSFTGAWASCEGAASSEECSRYVLVQRGARICGTWSYVASGRSYEGRLAARATSAAQARRTHVCGRPGSATNTECDEGWQTVDQPLELCDGRLSDMTGADGACLGDYEALPAAQAELAALQAESWVQACLETYP